MLNLINRTFESSSVDCNFNSNYDFIAAGYKYRCQMSNNLIISSPKSAQIVAVTGTHMSGKSNNDEIYFNAADKQIEYFPRGLEKFFSQLTGIAIWRSQLKEIHQDDLKLYTKLNYLNLGENNIEVIEDGLFDFQPNIIVFTCGKCSIFHISPTVFDDLPKLATLYLYGNKCTNQHSTNNRAGVLEVIESVKNTCISSDFVKLHEKLRNLEYDYMNLNPDNIATFKSNVKKFKNDLENSKFSKFESLKERVGRISNWKLLVFSDKIPKNESFQNLTAKRLDADISKLRTELNNKTRNQNDQIKSINDKIDRIENILSGMMKAQNATESENKSGIQNPWMIIAIGVVGITQTIILAVIYKEILS